MAKVTIAPTKSNLLRTKRDLSFAREGYEMLEQKRQILVLELIGSVETAKRTQEDLRAAVAAAFKALREAQLRRGTLELARQAIAPQAEHRVEIAGRSLMGIYLPTVSAKHPPRLPAVGLLSSSPSLDEVAAAFQKALEAADKMAQIENTVIRLAREVRKTQRRVNALEKIFIPAYQESIAYIISVLEERERDEFVVMRKVKERLQRSRRASQVTPQEGRT